MKMGAIFDSTKNYRYALWREWESDAPRVGFIMLNPSRADDRVDDPTIRRCKRFAHFWGYGSLEVMNLFAYRTPDPRNLRSVSDPIGPENDFHLLSLKQQVQTIVLAWGNWGTLYDRNQTVLELLVDHPVYCLGTTKLGNVRHPLYIKGNEIPVVYRK